MWKDFIYRMAKQTDPKNASLITATIGAVNKYATDGDYVHGTRFGPGASRVPGSTLESIERSVKVLSSGFANDAIDNNSVIAAFLSPEITVSPRVLASIEEEASFIASESDGHTSTSAADKKLKIAVKDENTFNQFIDDRINVRGAEVISGLGGEDVTRK